MCAVGFDIGTENCYIAVIKSDVVEIVDNEYNLHSTPAYIGFTEKSRDIGISAKAKMLSNLENTVFGIKRILGKTIEDPDLDEELVYLPHLQQNLVDLNSNDIGFKVNFLKKHIVYSVKQLMAMMLTKLKLTAEINVNNKIQDCVISVPVYYTDSQRRAMLDSVNIAGLNVLKLMNESTAVALAYGFYKEQFCQQQSQNVIFVDIGHSALTVTAANFTKEKLKILGCIWDDIGGRTFDNVLVQYFVEDFKDRYQYDVMASAKALTHLMNECESLKKRLSTTNQEHTFGIEYVVKEHAARACMRKTIFDTFSSHILQKIEKLLHKILDEAMLKASDVHSVEIVGGSSRMSSLKLVIEKVFGMKRSNMLHPDEAVARGCALQCALLLPSLKIREYTIEDKNCHAIKIVWINLESKEETLTAFLPSDILPCFKTITFSIFRNFSFTVYHCDPHTFSKMHKIGTFMIGNIPEDLNVDLSLIKVNLQAYVDINGIFYIKDAKLIISRYQNKTNDQSMSKQNNEDDAYDAYCKRSNSNVSEDEFKTESTRDTQEYELTVSAHVSELSDEKLRDYIEVEQGMVERFVKEKENADARNALEEYIYDMKRKIDFELKEYIVETDKEDLLQNLYTTENWLYEMDGRDTSQYTAKLRELRKDFDPAFNRKFEWEERQIIINEYHQTLQLFLTSIDAFQVNQKDKSFINKEDIETLNLIFNKCKRYLDQTLDIVSKYEKYVDAPITADEFRKVLNNFQKDFQDHTSLLNRKINSAQLSPITTSDKEHLAENRKNDTVPLPPVTASDKEHSAEDSCKDETRSNIDCKTENIAQNMPVT